MFAVVILRTAVGRLVFDKVGEAITGFLDLADRGSIFIFGENFRDHFFAFKVLPTIIFFSSFITVLYYLGIMQWVVRLFAWVMMRAMRTSGAESLSASANIFVGTDRGAAADPALRQDHDALGADGGDDRRLRHYRRRRDGGLRGTTVAAMARHRRSSARRQRDVGARRRW